MAQRMRAFKNISRFQKNPFAYIYWKIMPLHNAGRIRFTVIIAFYQLYMNLMTSWTTKLSKEAKEYMYWWRIGQVSTNHTHPHDKERMSVIRTKNYLRYSNFHQLRRNREVNQVTTNFWSRDQCFRKYFQMRKKHGIEPSMTGFKHIPMWEENQKKAQKQFDLMATRDYPNLEK